MRSLVVVAGIVGFFVVPLIVMKTIFVPTDVVWIIPGIFLFGGLWVVVLGHVWDAIEKKRTDHE